jgi:predicted aldo/keto reductase-like oxidoreductase
MANKEIGRRGFLKKLGLAGAVVSGTSLASCSSDNKSAQKWSVEGTGGEPTGEMTYRTNPNTGDKVSLLGYGCMRWPMKKDENGKDIVDQEKVNELVDYAIEHGVNFFDTAPVYLQGQSEAAMGIALKRHPRDKFFIATKMSNPRIPDFKQSVEMYRNSLKNLQVDYIDYYLLHSIGGGKGIETFKERFIDNGLLEFLLKEREAGRIRNLGWSFHGDVATFDYVVNMDVKWDFAMIQLNYVDWKHASRNNHAEYLYNELAKRNIPVNIMEPLLGGRLSKMADHLVARLKQRRPNDSVASWAFRFAGHHPGVLTVLSGMTYMEHLQDNIRTYSPLVTLTEDEKEFLFETGKLINQYPTIPCNDCTYCMPCPYGIDIPSILIHYNKCVNEGFIPKSQQDENYREARRAFLVGYDRSVPKLRQANHCIGCNQCSKHCPQRINIPRQLQRIDDFVEKLKQGTL